MDFLKECREYTSSWWECPQIVFVIIGFLIIFSSVFTYFVGERLIKDPLILGLIVSLLTILLLVLDYVLVRSFERLVEANRFKSQLTSFVAHQLRNPISNISLLLERAQKTGFKDPSLLEMVFSNLQEAKELLQDLSLVGKVERKRLSLQWQEVSLGGLIKEVIETLKPQAQKWGIKIATEVSQDFRVRADPHYLKEIIKILVENALVYSRGKGEKVTVRIKGEKNRVALEVEDEGIGIDPKEKKHIFQEFFRGKRAQKINPKGSGLGLYLAKKLIEQMGGELTFDSVPSKGSTFRVILPLK